MGKEEKESIQGKTLEDIDSLEDFLDYIYASYGYNGTVGFLVYFLGIGWKGENGPNMVKEVFKLYKNDKLEGKENNNEKTE